MQQYTCNDTVDEQHAICWNRSVGWLATVFYLAIWKQPSFFLTDHEKSNYDSGLFGASPSRTSVDKKRLQNCYFEKGSQPPDMRVLDADKSHQMIGSQTCNSTMQTTIWLYVSFRLGTGNLPWQLRCKTAAFFHQSSASFF